MYVQLPAVRLFPSLKARRCTDHNLAPGKPFAVNFTILPAMVTPNYQEIVQGAIDEGVTIIQTAGRSPDSIPLADGRNLMQMLKDANMIVIHKCMSVRHALTAQRIGVDCISLGGFEYGGHM